MDLKKCYGYDIIFMDMTEQKEVEPWQSQSNNNFRLFILNPHLYSQIKSVLGYSKKKHVNLA